MKIRFRHWWFNIPGARWSEGAVLFPWILFKQEPDQVLESLFRHELEHYYQVERAGFFRFYFKYLWYTIRLGYWNNPYEVEARMAAGKPLTEKERMIWDAAAASYYSKNR